MQDSIPQASQRTNDYFHGIARRLINDDNPKMGMDLGWLGCLGAWGWEVGHPSKIRGFLFKSYVGICWDALYYSSKVEAG